MTPRIFIVEDEPFFANMLSAQLKSLGYAVPAVCETGEEAVQVASSVAFDLAVIDLQLGGGIDGVDVAKTLSRQYGTPSVLMSGAADQTLIERAIDSHPYGFLSKPFNAQVLKATMETALQRNRTEIALRKREKQLEDILKTSMDGFFVLSYEAEILDLNDAACTITGFSREELLEKRLAEIESGRTHDQIIAGINTVLKKGVVQIERQIRRKDGTIRLLELNLAASPLAERCIYCFCRDITARRAAETRLQLLNRVVEQCPASIVITNTKGDIEYVNPYFEKCTGYDRNEALGQNPRFLNSGFHPKPFFENLWSTITSGRDWRGELCNRRKDGSIIWEQASVSPVRDDNGEIGHFVAVKEDITERKAAELMLAWQAALFENSTDLCCVKDLQLRVVAANQALARTAGVRDPEMLLGKTDREIFRSAKGQEAAEGYMRDEVAVQAMKPGQYLERQEKLFSADGSEHTLLTRKFPAFDRKGYLIGTANISTDITALKNAETELRRAKEDAEAANKAKGTFLATMSHELRTPLNVINGMSAVLSHGDWPPEHSHAIHLITEAGSTLLNIIEEILDYSGLQAGKTKLDQIPFSPTQVTFKALRLFSASSQAKGLRLSCSIAPDMPAELMGDPRRLQQILINLIHNAVKFTERGRVHISVRLLSVCEGISSLEFSIFDSGIGISPEHIQKLFRPFSQADDSYTRKFGGSGLGLVISRSFAQLMGGDITVRSQLGVGSVFQLHIRAGNTSQNLDVFRALSDSCFAGRKVLIAQRKGEPERMLVRMLAKWGMTTKVARSEEIGSASEGCHVAILAGDDMARAAKVLPRGMPAIWYGNPLGEKEPGHTIIGPCIDPSELSAALRSLFSQSPAKGTAPTFSASPAKTGALPLRILAAEDNRTNREVLKLVLTHLGYEADLVVNGAEAVEAVQQRKYDLLLLDIQMPVMDGLTAASEICRLFPDPVRRVRMVALTANALPGDRERCLAAGMDDYLSKPIVPADLKNCITKLFQGGCGSRPPQPQTAPALSMKEIPLIDKVHLQSITAGMAAVQVFETLRQLHKLVCDDYEGTFPRIVEVVGKREQKQFAETVHGLKGCFTMAGWARAGKFCNLALAAARQGQFESWATFSSELKSLFEQSSQAMSAHLMAIAPCETPKPIAVHENSP